jgi:hypothetical protein
VLAFHCFVVHDIHLIDLDLTREYKLERADRDSPLAKGTTTMPKHDAAGPFGSALHGRFEFRASGFTAAPAFRASVDCGSRPEGI